MPSCGKSVSNDLGPDLGDPVLASAHLTNQVVIALARGGENRNKRWPRRMTMLLPNASAAGPRPQNGETSRG